MAMEQTVSARRLVTGVGVIEYPVVRTDADGRIAEIWSDPSLRSDETLTPAFLDVHTHGAAGHDLMDATSVGMAAIGRFYAARGVGSYLATTLTAPMDATLRSLEELAGAVERADRPAEATPVGIHIEGPFVSHAKKGMHPAEWILPPTVAVFDRMWEAARGTIRLMTIAPEAPGAMEVIGRAVAVGVRVSIGHSNATAAEARAAIQAGAKSATHTFNVMRALDHREPGILGVVLDEADLYAELICDGVHVAPEMMRLWWKAKGDERGVLVTDSMAATGMPDGEYVLGGVAVHVAGGVCTTAGTVGLLAGSVSAGSVLAGSVLTMDRAVANLRAHTGMALETAVRMGSTNPARMLGIAGIGELRVGDAANLNRFDRAGRLVGTYLRGEAVAGTSR